MGDALIRSETKKLQQELNKLIALAITQHDMAKTAIAKTNRELALEVLEHDKKIDFLFFNFKAEAEFLITKRPLGKELRRTMAYFEIAHDIARIADYAKNICKFVIKTNTITSSTQRRIRAIHKPFREMLLKLETVIDDEKAEEAWKVIEMDNAIDKAVHKERKNIFQSIVNKTTKEEIEERIFAFSVINSLERAGDHGVHICEAVLYIATGEHNHEIN